MSNYNNSSAPNYRENLVWISATGEIVENLGLNTFAQEITIKHLNNNQVEVLKWCQISGLERSEKKLKLNGDELCKIKSISRMFGDINLSQFSPYEPTFLGNEYLMILPKNSGVEATSEHKYSIAEDCNSQKNIEVMAIGKFNRGRLMVMTKSFLNIFRTSPDGLGSFYFAAGR